MGRRVPWRPTTVGHRINGSSLAMIAPTPEPRQLAAMMDLDREQLRKTYEVCRLGFGILAGALTLACIDSLLPLLQHFSPWLCAQIISIPGYRWIGVPINW